jgi:CubicO group peptidase (beta-lactamase class C family)
MYALYHEKSVIRPNSLVEMLNIPETVLHDPDGGKYGLGVVDYTDLLGVQAIGHGGSSLGYSAAALYLPEYGIVIVWLINTGESPSALASQMMSQSWSLISEVIIMNQRSSSKAQP